MQSPQEKALSKSAGTQYKKGFTKGDLAKHKRENFRIKLEMNRKDSGPKRDGSYQDRGI